MRPVKNQKKRTNETCKRAPSSALFTVWQIYQKKPSCIKRDKRDLQKRLTKVTYKRDLPQKRLAPKETYKRDLQGCLGIRLKIAVVEVGQMSKETFINKKRQKQNTATHCNTLQHTATHCNIEVTEARQICPQRPL